MGTMYKVTGHAAHATMTTPTGRVRQLFFKGQLLPPDTPDAEVKHLLSVKLITPVEVGPAVEATTEPAEGEGAGDVGGQPNDGDGSPDGEGAAAGEGGETPPAGDEEKQWAEAQAKAQALVASGSKPDGRSAPLTIAAFLVEKGYDEATVRGAEKKDLLDLVTNLQ